jgi:GcrA cell cycle regulator
MDAQAGRPVMSRSDEAVLLKLLLSRPAFPRWGGLQLRCAEVTPRHLELTELEAGYCRYPYGGDEAGEAITFCGRPCRKGSSYCAPHFRLTRNPDVPTERTTDVAPPPIDRCGMIKS